MSRGRREPQRRGNALILVSGILVLLVIIATAYISRTQSEREVAVAVQRANTRDDIAEVVARDVADFVGAVLFAAPIDLPPGAPLAADANALRLIPDPQAVRYSIDLPDFPYNAAPYHVAAWSNWPDEDLITDPGYFPLFPDYVAPPDDRVGNPGTNDSTWLRDLEPQRLILDDPDGRPFSGDEVVIFTHWLHLTNIARANNGYRIVRDIRDVLGAGLVTDLNFPVEQWLPILHDVSGGNDQYVPFGVNTTSLSFGGASLFADNPTDFMNRWAGWFGCYPYAYNGYVEDECLSGQTALGIPPNFYKLNNLRNDADGIAHNWFIGAVPQEAPESEFIAGTARHTVSRVLVDTDGDGFTDSFWFLVPASADSGIRTILAVSIFDNSGMVNVNTATHFVRDDPGNQSFPRTATVGHTPADTALIGSGLNVSAMSVGLFDNPVNHENGSLYAPVNVDFSFNHWDNDGVLDILSQVGIQDNPNYNQFFISAANEELFSQRDRAQYWRLAGVRPQSPLGGLTPFELADEIELRMFAGQNYPYVLSRLERAVNTTGNTNSLLRTSLDREESSEFLDQLTNVELLHDLRRKLTTFSGARNDLTPPWLWWRDVNVPAHTPPLTPDEEAQFIDAFRFKLDLRDADDIFAAPTPGSLDEALLFRNLLPYTIWLALTDRAIGPDDGQSFFGTYNSGDLVDAEQTRRLATSLAANLLARRDDDTRKGDDGSQPDSFSATPDVLNSDLGPDTLAESSLPIPEIPGLAAVNDQRLLGLEPQPFIMEAFLAHVYRNAQPSNGPIDPLDPIQGGPNYVITDLSDPDNMTTVIAVQIANPFDRWVDLADYRLDFYGRPFNFPAGKLGPGTEKEPRTAVVLAVAEDFDGDAQFGDKWRDFLDIANGDLFGPPNSDEGSWRFDATLAWVTNTTINDFDDPMAKSVELYRQYPGGLEVLVDRIDDTAASPDNSFGNMVNSLARTTSPNVPPEEASPAIPGFTNGIRIGNDDFWVVWARAGRVWGYDVDLSSSLDPDERAPRFIFSARPDAEEAEANDFNVGRRSAGGGPVRFKGSAVDSADSPDAIAEPEAWITREYANPGALAPLTYRRKPTFFQCVSAFNVADPVYGNYAAVSGGNTVYLADKGVLNTVDYFFPASLQMLQKEGDFEQVGELLNIWMWGHQIEVEHQAGSNNTIIQDYRETDRTFSEFMSDESLMGNLNPLPPLDEAARAKLVRVNRLPLISETDNNPVLGVGDPNELSDPRHSMPRLTAVSRLLEAFVCDGPGVNYFDVDSGNPTVATDDLDLERLCLRNANGFSGKMTPGLINLNPATLETIRALPHLYRLVHETGLWFPDGPTGPNPPTQGITDAGPRARYAESIIQYRERYDGGISDTLPAFAALDTNQQMQPARGPALNIIGGLREDRGLASIGELPFINRDPANSLNQMINDKRERQNWRADFAAQNPYRDSGGSLASTTIEDDSEVIDAQISTDTIDSRDLTNPGSQPPWLPDDIVGDAEEQSLLFAGVSNLVTTRSDVFTVYLKVRSFRQDPITGVWDATKRENIVDDSRYVMLVDRSGVNSPLDKPVILYMEKLPK